MGTRWSSLGAPLDVKTGDVRRFAHDADINRRNFPMPMKWQREAAEGHDNAITIGSIDTMQVTEDAKIQLGGELFDDSGLRRLSDDIDEFKLLADKGVLGLSVDLESDLDVKLVAEGSEDDLDFFDVIFGNEKLEVLFTRATVMGATAVQHPAFGETGSGEFTVEVDEEDKDKKEEEEEAELALTANEGEVFTVIGSTSLPIADRDTSWSGSAATKRMLEMGTSAARRGHFYRDPDGDPETAAAYKLPFADVIDGTLKIVPKGVAAAAGGRGVNAANIPGDEKTRIKRKICTIYGKLQRKFDDWPDCPFAKDNTEAALTASVQVVELPPKEFVENPKLEVPTPLRVDGKHVYGHLALEGTCHVRFPNICVTPPHSGTEHALFNRYAIDTDGGTVFAGRLTGKANHPSENLSMTAAMTEYDKFDVFAHVVAGVDELGIWISGVLSDDIDQEGLDILARQKISGDWREHGDGLELIEALALKNGPRHLSEPGFPILASMRNGKQRSLIACLGPTDEDVAVESAVLPDPSELAKLIVDEQENRMKLAKKKANLAEKLTNQAKTRLMNRIGG